MKSILVLLLTLAPNFCSCAEISGVYSATGIYAVASVPTPKPTTAPVAAVHSHKCSYDGTTWNHTEHSYGSIADHTCPRCGRVQWMQQPKVQIAPCPSGRCPLRR